jgi:5-methylcytosine-specific restriction endonuclease McrA
MNLKHKPTRLKGKPLAALNKSIHDRDGDCCLLCGSPVDPGVKFHHIVFKSQGGGDTEDNGATLRLFCHIEAHGELAADIREALQKMMRRKYGDNNS